jgi:putative transposase
MSRRAFSDINLHIVWHTKDDVPVLRDAIERHVHRFLRHRAVKESGVFCHAVNGTDDHVHVVLSVPPELLISEWVGRLKGACSYHINDRVANRRVLAWQAGYGVVSFGKKDLSWVVDYVARQREHHRRGRAHERLERIVPVESPGNPAEAG